MDTSLKMLFDDIRTDNKLNELLIAPSYKKGGFDSHGVDCPFLFYHDSMYWMTYVGWDGIGYQTGLALSHDLINWEKKRLLLARGPKGSVTEFNMAMTSIIRDNDLFGPGNLKKINGQFVGTYHAYPDSGYEAGPASIGLCFSDDLLHWNVEDPILKPESTCLWESGGLYKSWIMEFEGSFFLFYNAKNKTEKSVLWTEETGVAISKNLIHWERYSENPVLKVGISGEFDDIFASDPCVLRYKNKWIMFYFGNSSDGHARESAAFSEDLLHWEKSNEILLDVGLPESIDSIHAHKPGIIAKAGEIYHFYCAVAPAKTKYLNGIEQNEVRGITLAKQIKD